jgi:metal-dependent HD superfamily phosphatase/phosphodiesterase
MMPRFMPWIATGVTFASRSLPKREQVRRAVDVAAGHARAADGGDMQRRERARAGWTSGCHNVESVRRSLPA